MFYEILSLRTAYLGVLPLLWITFLWQKYTTRHADVPNHKKRDNATAVPSTFPHFFPLLGSLPLAYVWNPRGFVLSPKSFFQSIHPVRVKILHYEFYVLRSQENVKQLFKNSSAFTANTFAKFALVYAFAWPAKAAQLYDKDDSGSAHVPHPDSTVEPRNRIDYLVHQSLVQFLEGKGLLPFWNRYADNITRQIRGLYDRIGADWEFHADLMKLVEDEATVSVFNSLCGPHLLRLNSNFLEDFYDFDRNLQTYLQGVPWFFAPRAYAARKRVLNAVASWQQYARDNCKDPGIDDDADDEFWGSAFFRKRQRIFLEMDGVDYNSMAYADFGFIWAVRNATTASSWAVFEIFRDLKLLASVRTEIDSCIVKGPNESFQFDTDRLFSMPVLQAVYAETLRLRMHFYIIRMADRTDVNIRDWIIPRQKVIVTSTTVAHMDSEVWNTGPANEHPVDQFWVGRFLTYREKNPNGSSHPNNSHDGPVFSTKGLEGAWIPYGGGPRQCPGRNFARRQILLTTALMVSMFDCDILESGRDLKEDLSLKGFGSGMSHPAGKVPMRIRRRSGRGQ